MVTFPSILPPDPSVLSPLPSASSPLSSLPWGASLLFLLAPRLSSPFLSSHKLNLTIPIVFRLMEATFLPRLPSIWSIFSPGILVPSPFRNSTLLLISCFDYYFLLPLSLSIIRCIKPLPPLTLHPFPHLFIRPLHLSLDSLSPSNLHFLPGSNLKRFLTKHEQTYGIIFTFGKGDRGGRSIGVSVPPSPSRSTYPFSHHLSIPSVQVLLILSCPRTFHLCSSPSSLFSLPSFLAV